MEHENNQPGQQSTPEEMHQLWQERYGDMVPEKIIDTKIGADGKRYYKVQWAATTMEPGKNFLEAELLIKKYWDPVEKKLRFPSRENDDGDEEEGASSSRQRDDEYDDDGDEEESSEGTKNDIKLNVKYDYFETSKENTCGTSSASDLEFVVANIEKETETTKTNDIIDNSSSRIESSDFFAITKKCVEGNPDVKEQEEEEEHSLKRKRCDSDRNVGSGVISSECCEINASTEVAIKKSKDDNAE